MRKSADFLKRNAALAFIAAVSIYFLRAERPEIDSLLFVAAVESVALALSGAAAFIFSSLDFKTREGDSNLGLIFLGTHVCAGLTIIGVYMARLQ